MKPSPLRLPAVRTLAFASLLSLGATGPSARATTYTWTGNDTALNENNWSSALNWANQQTAVSASSTDVIFGALGSSNATGASNQDEGSPFVLDSLSFNASAPAYTLTGNPFSLGAGGFNDSSANTETISNAVTLTSNQTWTYSSAAGTLALAGGVDTAGYAVTVNSAGAGNVLDGVIAGNGGLFKTGAGTLALTGGNTYAGGTTITSGTLQVGSGGTTGSLGTGGVTDNGSLVFNRSDSPTVANAVSGSGSVTQSGGGTVTLTGANSYSGATAINAGTLQVGNGGTTGSLGSGSVTVNGALVFNRPDNVTVANAISGNGSFTQAGTGNVTITGANTYTGGTSVNSGTLTVGTGGSIYTGTESSTVQNVIVNAGAALVVNGTGSITVGSGTPGEFLTFIVDGTTANPANATLNDNGQINSEDAYIGLNGSGVFTQNGGTFTQRPGGFDHLIIGDGSGAVGVYNLNGGTLTTDSTFVALDGTGTFNQNGGTHITRALSVVGESFVGGNNSAVGTYNLDGGLLEVNDVERDAGTGTFNFNGGTLEARENNTAFMQGLTTVNVQANGARINTNGYNVTIAQQLQHDTTADAPSGDGGLIKSGNGTLTLSGANTYAGNTTVNAGVLLAANTSGSAAGTGTVRVNAGATLGGNGTISGAVTVQSGGTLAPGELAVSQLTLGSNLNLNNGSNLAITLDGTTAGKYDQVRLAGTLTLGGNLSVAAVPGFTLAVNQTFLIVEDTGSAAISGKFANVTSGGIYTDAAGDTFQVNYADNSDGGAVGNDVLLTVETVVPEPGTWALLGVGIVAAVLATRRTRRTTGPA